jgi:ArsR family transcriptional regulator
MQFSEVFGALSNPNRLHIFLRLAACCRPGTACGTDSGTRSCVGEIGEGMGIAPSTLSHHIKELRRAGLVRIERRGQRVECWVDPQILRDLSEFFSQAVDEEPT